MDHWKPENFVTNEFFPNETGRVGELRDWLSKFSDNDRLTIMDTFAGILVDHFKSTDDHPFIWNGRGSFMVLTEYDHVHDSEGHCLKRRNGDPCGD